MKRAAAVVFALAIMPVSGALAQCRDPGGQAFRTIGRQIELLRAIEEDAAMRWTAGQQDQAGRLLASTQPLVATVITGAGLWSARVRHCRNWVPPIRRACVDAAVAFRDLMGEFVVRAVSEETRKRYTAQILKCERWLGLPPLTTRLRLKRPPEAWNGAAIR